MKKGVREPQAPAQHTPWQDSDSPSDTLCGQGHCPRPPVGPACLLGWGSEPHAPQSVRSRLRARERPRFVYRENRGQGGHSSQEVSRCRAASQEVSRAPCRLPQEAPATCKGVLLPFLSRSPLPRPTASFPGGPLPQDTFLFAPELPSLPSCPAPAFHGPAAT